MKQINKQIDAQKARRPQKENTMIYISAIFFPLFAAFMGNQIFPTDFMTIVSVIIAAELVILYAIKHKE